MYCCSGRDRLVLETIVDFDIPVIPCIAAQAGTDWVSKQLPSVIFQWFHVLLLRQGQIGFGNNCRLWYSSDSMYCCSGRDSLGVEKLSSFIVQCSQNDAAKAGTDSVWKQLSSLIFQWFHYCLKPMYSVPLFLVSYTNVQVWNPPKKLLSLCTQSHETCKLRKHAG